MHIPFPIHFLSFCPHFLKSSMKSPAGLSSCPPFLFSANMPRSTGASGRCSRRWAASPGPATRFASPRRPAGPWPRPCAAKASRSCRSNRATRRECDSPWTNSAASWPRFLNRHRPALLHANSLAMGRLSGPVAAELALPSLSHLRDIVTLSRQAIADLNCHTRLLAVSAGDAAVPRRPGTGGREDSCLV